MAIISTRHSQTPNQTRQRARGRLKVEDAAAMKTDSGGNLYTLSSLSPSLYTSKEEEILSIFQSAPQPPTQTTAQPLFHVVLWPFILPIVIPRDLIDQKHSLPNLKFQISSGPADSSSPRRGRGEILWDDWGGCRIQVVEKRNIQRRLK